MAEITCETIEATGDAKIVVYLSPYEVDLIVSTWDVPINFKHMLLDAKKAAGTINND